MPAVRFGLTMLVAVSVACAPSVSSAPETVYVFGADTIISVNASDSVFLGTPVDLVIDGEGSIYVLDQMEGHVLRIPTAGTVTTIGRRGSGPGEFYLPMTLGIAGDTLRVDDRGNGRIQVFTLSGEYVRSYKVPISGSARISFRPNGSLLLETRGVGGVLVSEIDPDGEVLAGIGGPLAPASRRLNFLEMKDEVRQGRVPTALKNNVIPVAAGDTTVWLLLSAEGTVRRMGATGMRAEASLDIPEINLIRDEFFKRNRAEQSASVFYPLSFAADAVVVGPFLFVLLQLPELDPSVVLAFHEDGRLWRRWVFEEIRGARGFAIEEGSNRIYFIVPGAAALIAANLTPSPTGKETSVTGGARPLPRME